MMVKSLPAPTDAEAVASALMEGGVAIVPTKRWYMLATLAENNQGCERLFAYKGRSKNKPLLLNLPRKFELQKWFSINRNVELLSLKLWPGDLAIRVHWRDEPQLLSKYFGIPALVGIADGVLGDITSLVGCPLAVTSANTTARSKSNPGPSISPDELSQFVAFADAKIDAWIDGGISPIGKHMTVVDVSGDAPLIERLGTTCIRALNNALDVPIRNTESK